MARQGSAPRLGIASVALGVLAATALPAAADPDPAVAGTPAAPPAPPATPAAPPTPPGPPAPPPAPPGSPAPPSGDLTAADVAGAPLPGDESGRIAPGDRGDSAVRRTLRALLFVPRVVVDVLLSPFAAATFAYDRYHLEDLYYRVFFNDARTIGVVPSAWYESGFGFTVGARLVDLDLFGAYERLSIGVQGGGRYHAVFQGALDSGDRLGDLVHAEVFGQYEQRPKDPFYGIGNRDRSHRLPPAPVDPTENPLAIETRFRQRIERVAGVIDFALIDRLHLLGASELVDREFSRSEYGVPITRVYDRTKLVGYGGVRYIYSELEVRFDSRRRASVYEPMPFTSRGSLAAVFGGFTHALDGASDYWRYGVDLQQFVRLASGPRVLALRLHGEGVTGSRSEVPFTELPRLGGPTTLRGYPTDRFRDRIAAFGTIEYAWDLSNQLAASLFVDGGRVLRSFDDPGGGHVRVDFGVGIQGHTETLFVFQGSLATSIDGGVFLNFSFTPAFAISERVRRR